MLRLCHIFRSDVIDQSRAFNEFLYDNGSAGRLQPVCLPVPAMHPPCDLGIVDVGGGTARQVNHPSTHPINQRLSTPCSTSAT